MKVSEWITTEDVKVSTFRGKDATLPKGSFVKPIDLKFVPKEVFDTYAGKWFDKQSETFIYCYYGLAAVRWDKIREIK